MNVPWWAWLGTVAVLALLICADLMLTRSARGSSPRRAAAGSALWIAAGCAFGGVLWLWQGSAIAGQYFAGYLLEKSLSVDNIFLFVLLFASLGVPARLQRHVLYLGVLGALVLRGVFIAAGGALIEHVSWVFYLFGVLVLAAGIRMFRSGAAVDPSKNPVLRGLRRVVPVTGEYRGTRLLARVNGRTAATPLLVALIAIETTDLVFALDSIPAVFGVTRDMFLVFTSNAFAVLGLRALYFLFAQSMDRFSYLRPGLAILLVFVGLKMLISPLIELPVVVSLAVIITVVGWAVAASLWRQRADRWRRIPARPAGPEGPVDVHRPLPVSQPLDRRLTGTVEDGVNQALAEHEQRRERVERYAVDRHRQHYVGFFRRRGERLVGDQDDAGAAGLRHRDDLPGDHFVAAQVQNDHDRAAPGAQVLSHVRAERLVGVIDVGDQLVQLDRQHAGDQAREVPAGDDDVLRASGQQ